jgi:hypothetical protein
MQPASAELSGMYLVGQARGCADLDVGTAG